jgi:hypothetical protein
MSTVDSRRERSGHDNQHVYKQVTLASTTVTRILSSKIFFPSLANESDATQEQKQIDQSMETLRFNSMGSRPGAIQLAQQETCPWLCKTLEYVRWRDPQHRRLHHGFFWNKGKPGFGRSTMMRHALRQDQENYKQDTLVSSFFFDARGFGLEKTTEGMSRSLLHHLYYRDPSRITFTLLQFSSPTERELAVANASRAAIGRSLQRAEHTCHDLVYRRPR